MRAAASFLAGLACVAAWPAANALRAEVAPLQAPAYTASSIVNGASALPGPLAPNTIVTVYGTNLCFSTRALAANDIRDGRVPTLLPQTGVRVLIGGVPAPLYFVSPKQINFLVPPDLVPGNVELQVIRDGVAGPEIKLRVESAAPSLFQLDETTPIVVASDGAIVSSQRPARPGDVVILFATGLGPVVPPTTGGEIPKGATPLANSKRFALLWDSQIAPAQNILYVGLAPGFPGLYQINFRLPPSPAGSRIPLRIAYDDLASQDTLSIPVN
ncbi:MAG: IPT/TIG domain-containing protein [Bryobacterales bacterium]|nr:IPT/TIG domain-containing protein [Bryobacterales bacterium]